MKENMVTKTGNYDVVLKRGNGDHVYMLFSDNDTLKDVEVLKEFRGDKTYRVDALGNELYEITNIKVKVDPITSQEVLVLDSIEDAINIYQTERFDDVGININTTNSDRILEFLSDPNADKRLNNLYNSISNSISRISESNPNRVISGIRNAMKRKEMNENEMLEESSKIKYSSFLKSLDFVAARIPSQAMQSFMPMEVIEFSDTDKNTAYVANIQIWLQGSKQSKLEPKTA